jgi:hypothetical protein
LVGAVSQHAAYPAAKLPAKVVPKKKKKKKRLSNTTTIYPVHQNGRDVKLKKE